MGAGASRSGNAPDPREAVEIGVSPACNARAGASITNPPRASCSRRRDRAGSSAAKGRRSPHPLGDPLASHHRGRAPASAVLAEPVRRPRERPPRAPKAGRNDRSGCERPASRRCAGAARVAAAPARCGDEVGDAFAEHGIDQQEAPSSCTSQLACPSQVIRAGSRLPARSPAGGRARPRARPRWAGSGVAGRSGDRAPPAETILPALGPLPSRFANRACPL